MEKVFYHSLHIRLWTWLAENPGKEKIDWPEWIANGGAVDDVDGECFACKYRGLDDCENSCPLDFDIKENGCLGYLYRRWMWGCNDYQERSETALQIANLPVRAGVITK